MKWHEDAKTRANIGDQAESRFARDVRCHCGGEFTFIGNAYPGCPDFTCSNCEQLVDIKYSPQAERTGNIAVSAIPWSKYPDDLLLITFYHGKWIAGYKRDIRTSNNDPFAPTHRSRATRFYLIACDQLQPIQDFGLTVKKRTN